jgi:serine/threonine protein kinase
MAGISNQISMNNGMPQPFGKYLLIQKIASGGMAEIFKAKMTGEGGFEKLVAIKRILPHLSQEPDFLAMFMKEARLAALLSHQNIVQIYDFGKVDGLYYIAMEYLPGSDLRTILERAKHLPRHSRTPLPLGIDSEPRQTLPVECSLYIVSRICAGLDYSHNIKDLSGAPLNIIHRDINPQNILITHEGEIKIVDFGIAKISEQDTATKVGVLKGKVAYMSPEQAAGQPLDKRSDIFSAGSLLYEMVTGKRAFPGETMEVLERVRNADFTPPERLAPGLPGDVYEILGTALARNPADRFQSCAELYMRLDDCLTNHYERQNAENLARRLRPLLSDDIAAESNQPDRDEASGGSCDSEQSDEVESTATWFATATGGRFARNVSWRGKVGSFRLPLDGVAALLFAVLFVFSLFYLNPSRNSEPNKLGEALAAVEAKQFSKALELFDALLAHDPELLTEVATPYAAALLHEGVQLVASDPLQASRLIERSIAVDPSEARAYFELGKLHTKLHNYPNAIAHYRKATELDERFPEAFFNLGFLYAQTADYARAEEMFQRAVNLSPPYLDEAYFNLAVVQKSQGKTQESIRSLEQAVAANPLNKRAVEYLRRFLGES